MAGYNTNNKRFYPYFGWKTKGECKKANVGIKINVVDFTSICIVPSCDDGRY